MIRKIIDCLLIAILITIIFFIIPNKSNISKYFIVPLIVALSIKYIYGDWDTGSKYSLSDISYFLAIFVISIITLKLLDSLQLIAKNKKE